MPSDVTIDCAGFPEMPNPVITDNCDTDIDFVLTVDTIPTECENAYTLIRTWTALDACGNEDSVSQEIFVTDGEAPIVFNTPTDITVDLTIGETIPGPITLNVFDACDSTPEVAIEEIQTTGCSYEIQRTYVIIDNCDNETRITPVSYTHLTLPTILRV